MFRGSLGLLTNLQQAHITIGFGDALRADRFREGIKRTWRLLGFEDLGMQSTARYSLRQATPEECEVFKKIRKLDAERSSHSHVGSS